MNPYNVLVKEEMVESLGRMIKPNNYVLRKNTLITNKVLQNYISLYNSFISRYSLRRDLAKHMFMILQKEQQSSKNDIVKRLMSGNKSKLQQLEFTLRH